MLSSSRSLVVRRRSRRLRAPVANDLERRIERELGLAPREQLELPFNLALDALAARIAGRHCPTCTCSAANG